MNYSSKRNNFEIHKKIGEGSYGKVYRARMKDLDKIVAIKVIKTTH